MTVWHDARAPVPKPAGDIIRLPARLRAPYARMAGFNTVPVWHCVAYPLAVYQVDSGRIVVGMRNVIAGSHARPLSYACSHRARCQATFRPIAALGNRAHSARPYEVLDRCGHRRRVRGSASAPRVVLW